VPRAYEEKGACESQNDEKRGLRKPKMRGKGLTKVKMKAIDPQKILLCKKILKVPRAYESLNPGMNGSPNSFANIQFFH
jgi:hypothetical protein